MSDLSTDDEERVHHHMRCYEKKIDGLMSEVGSLKSEVNVSSIIVNPVLNVNSLKQYCLKTFAVQKKNIMLQDICSRRN